MNTEPKLVYSKAYNIAFYGLEKLHSFDSCKYGRAWNNLFDQLREEQFDIRKITVKPTSKVSDDEILLVHGEQYALRDIWDHKYLSTVLELPLLGLVPSCVATKVVKEVLESMKWSTAGTVKAAELALAHTIAVNMSGGYHHAQKNNGGGFCVYSDVPIAIRSLRKRGYLTEGVDKIIIIDLDAHQGDGFERILGEDNDVFILDVYNGDIFPGDEYAKQYIMRDIPLCSGTRDEQYLNNLETFLPELLDQIRCHNSVDQPKLAFYNAGTDIYEKDPLGRLSISRRGILKRDMYVLEQLVERKIPCVITLSGGYTPQSYTLVSNTLRQIIKKYHPEFCES